MRYNFVISKLETLMFHFHSSKERIKWAANALRYELVDFWRDYPFEVVRQAGPKSSLHYYVFSDKLSWSGMELDHHGVPQFTRRLFTKIYSPSSIAWYGLVKLEKYLRGTNSAGKDIFLKQAQWLASHYQEQPSGAVVWPFTFDWQEGQCSLRAPWISAYAQGYVISALVRAYRITREKRFLELSLRGADVFVNDIESVGVRSLQDGHVMYAEYPGYPTPRILDGFITSLFGLYDLHVETGDEKVRTLFEEGVNGLRCLLPYWDYRGKWSWYGSQFYLSPRQYHTQNQKLLLCLAYLCNDPYLKAVAEGWDLNRLSFLQMFQVYGVHVLTKNACRIRNRTWKQHKGSVLDRTAVQTKAIQSSEAPTYP
jgi:hypothetical protein